MSGDIVQTLLGNGAVTLFILALIGLYQKLKENRSSLRAAAELREQRRYENDSDWINAYRAAAEQHLQYDQEVLTILGETRYEIQRLRAGQHLPPAEFTPLPHAPPLFPTPPK
jgi:hypothetical protein